MRRSLCVVLALASTVVGLLSAPAVLSASTDPTLLPTSSFSHLLLDDAHSHVYVTDGAQVMVRAMDGSRVTEIAEPGAAGLALSPDGSTLYVALASANAIAAINTSTLTEKARYATGASTCPATVAPVGAKVWFGYGCAAGKGAIGLLSWVSGKPSISAGRATGFRQAPELRISAQLPGTMVASGDYGLDVPKLTTYKVLSNTSLSAVKTLQINHYLADMALTADGKTLVTASIGDSWLRKYNSANLAFLGNSSLSSSTNAVAIGSTGLLAAGQDASAPHDVQVDGPSGSVVKLVDLDGPLRPAGLAFDRTGKVLYAVTTDSSGGVHLRIVPNADIADVNLALSAPATALVGAPLTVSGTARSLDQAFGGAALAVRRTDAAGDTTLASVTTAGDGTFAFTDTPGNTGSVTYTVSYAGDTTHLPASAAATVQVAAAVTSLTLRGSTSLNLGDTESLSALLSSGSKPVVGATVKVARTDANGTVQLGQFTTDQYGRIDATDKPVVAGSTTYTATFEGTATLQQSTASLTVNVSQPTTAMTLSVPQSVTLGSSVPVNGTLTYGGNPVANATIALSRTDSAGVVVQLGQLTTNPNGAFSTSDTPTVAGTYSYRAAFAGSGTLQPVEAKRQVWVQAPASSLTVTGPQSAASGQAIVLTGSLRAPTGAPITGATITVTAGATGAQWSVPSVVTDSQGNYTVTNTPPATVSGSVTYYLRFAGDGQNGSAEASWSVKIG